MRRVSIRLRLSWCRRFSLLRVFKVWRGSRSWLGILMRPIRWPRLRGVLTKLISFRNGRIGRARKRRCTVRDLFFLFLIWEQVIRVLENLIKVLKRFTETEVLFLWLRKWTRVIYSWRTSKSSRVIVLVNVIVLLYRSDSWRNRYVENWVDVKKRAVK